MSKKNKPQRPMNDQPTEILPAAEETTVLPSADQTTVLPSTPIQGTEDEATAILPSVEETSVLPTPEQDAPAVVLAISSEDATGNTSDEKELADEDKPSEGNKPADEDEPVDGNVSAGDTSTALPNTDHSAPSGSESPSAASAADMHSADPAAAHTKADPATPTSPKPTQVPNAGAAPAASGPTKPPTRPTLPPEAPYRGTRIGLLLWAGCVAVVGLFMIAASFLSGISLPMLLTVLLGGFGVSLLVAAVISAINSKRR